MSDLDLTWITDAINAQAFNPADGSHRVFMAVLSDVLDAHPHTRDVFDPGPGTTNRGFGCRCCHADRYEFTEGLGWCPTVRAIADQNALALPDNPDHTPTQEKSMTAPTPPVPLTFQAPTPSPVPQPTAAPAPQQPTEQMAAVASAALQAEAAAPAPGEPFPVVAITYDGQTYTVPASAEDWPVAVLIAIDDQKMTHAVRALLGPKQWIRFMATEPRMKAVGGVFEAAAKAAGFDSAGE